MIPVSYMWLNLVLINKCVPKHNGITLNKNQMLFKEYHMHNHNNNNHNTNNHNNNLSTNNHNNNNHINSINNLININLRPSNQQIPNIKINHYINNLFNQSIIQI